MTVLWSGEALPIVGKPLPDFVHNNFQRLRLRGFIGHGFDPREGGFGFTGLTPGAGQGSHCGLTVRPQTLRNEPLAGGGEINGGSGFSHIPVFLVHLGPFSDGPLQCLIPCGLIPASGAFHILIRSCQGVP